MQTSHLAPRLRLEIARLQNENQQLVDALRRVYMWISDPALGADEDTALVEARRICREAFRDRV